MNLKSHRAVEKYKFWVNGAQSGETDPLVKKEKGELLLFLLVRSL